MNELQIRALWSKICNSIVIMYYCISVHKCIGTEHTTLIISSSWWSSSSAMRYGGGGGGSNIKHNHIMAFRLAARSTGHKGPFFRMMGYGAVVWENAPNIRDTSQCFIFRVDDANKDIGYIIMFVRIAIKCHHVYTCYIGLGKIHIYLYVGQQTCI